METKVYQTGIGKFSTYVAVTSFVIGTVLFLLGMANKENETLMFAGFLYVGFALCLNKLVLIALIFCCFKDWQQRQYYARKILLLLANVPIAACYFYILIIPTA